VGSVGSCYLIGMKTGGAVRAHDTLCPNVLSAILRAVAIPLASRLSTLLQGRNMHHIGDLDAIKRVLVGKRVSNLRKLR